MPRQKSFTVRIAEEWNLLPEGLISTYRSSIQNEIGLTMHKWKIREHRYIY